DRDSDGVLAEGGNSLAARNQRREVRDQTRGIITARARVAQTDLLTPVSGLLIPTNGRRFCPVPATLIPARLRAFCLPLLIVASRSESGKNSRFCSSWIPSRVDTLEPQT